MKLASYILVVLTGGFIIAGCSEVGFDSIPKLSCEDLSRDQKADCDNNAESITVSFSFNVGEVDILFVNDNSGSMFVEQQKMANEFPTFLSNISNLLYRIGIITTDVSASPNNAIKRAANGNGAYQDGRLLEFVSKSSQNKSGLKFITRDTPNVEDLFKGTIERNETKACDASGFNPDMCPSTDERGIYAANMAIDRGESGFFRSGAHLAIIVLSDEDERSAGGKNGYPTLESKDLPESLVLNLKEKYPTKSLSVHSVVTDSETCRKQQTQTSTNGIWPTLGFIGSQYMKLSNPTADLLALGNLMPGVVGSICAVNSSYEAQIGNISEKIRDDAYAAPKQLVCTPKPGTIKVITNPTGYENDVEFEIDANNKVRFGDLPSGIRVTFSYDCPRY